MDHRPPPEQLLVQAEVWRCVEEIAESERDITVFELYYRQGFTAREIAAVEGFHLSEKGVESCLHRLLSRLKETLNSSANLGGKKASYDVWRYRMRTPEDHLTSAEVIRGRSERQTASASEVSSEIEQHAAQCSECAALLQLHEALMVLPESMKCHDEDCISEDEIYRFAARASLTDDEAALRHISKCSRCAALLKEAVYDLGTRDPSVELDEAVESQQFLSSDRSWQQDMASRMVRERKADTMPHNTAGLSVVPIRRKLHWVYGPVAAMLIAAIALTYFYRAHQRDHSVDSLLAKSYNARRLTELRIPGGSPVELFSPSLGASNPSTMPSQLLEAKLEAQRHLDQKSDDPHWQQVQGEIALVERNGEEARHSLEYAQTLDPALPRIKFDLASAYFEIGEANKDPIWLARATEFYGRYIDGYSPTESKGMLALAYYNLALSEEKQAFDSVAREHYQRALPLETDPAWRKDIESRIDALPKPLHGDGSSDSTDRTTTLPSPGNFLHAETQSGDKPVDDYEIYLEAATRNWIAETPRSHNTYLALGDLARIGLKHHDAWLREFLSQPPGEGDEHLARAVSANLQGDAGFGVLEARQASGLYGRTRNLPGSLRAQVEEIYALQRLGKSHDCLQLASPLEKSAQLDRYAWLKGYLLLELASCQGAAGDLLPSTRPLRASLAVAQGAHLRLEQLRAEGFLADQLSMLGQPREAWLIASAGLNTCVHTRGAAMRTYQFLSTIQTSAAAEGLLWTAAITANAASEASLSLDNSQIKAYAQEQLGIAEAAVHHLSAAQIAFASAKQQLKGLSDRTAAALYDADWTADRADLLEQGGDLPGALQQMRSVSPEIASSDNHALRQHYFDEYGHLLLNAHRSDLARLQALQATADAELAARTLQSGVEKLTWERDNARGYRILVESLINPDDPALSLRAWEWFRSASYRSTWLADRRAAVPARLPPMPDLPAVPENELMLVYAQLDHGYAAWSIEGSRTQQVRLRGFL